MKKSSAKIVPHKHNNRKAKFSLTWLFIKQMGYPLTWYQKPENPIELNAIFNNRQNFMMVQLDTQSQYHKTLPTFFIPGNKNKNICIFALPGRACTMAEPVFIERVLELQKKTECSAYCLDSRHLCYRYDNEGAPILNDIQIDQEVAKHTKTSNFEVLINDCIQCLIKVKSKHNIDGFIFAGHSLGGLKLSAVLKKINSQKDLKMQIPVLGLFCSISIDNFFSGVWHHIQTMISSKIPLSARFIQNNGLIANRLKRWFIENGYQLTFEEDTFKNTPLMITGYPEGDNEVSEQMALINKIRQTNNPLISHHELMAPKRIDKHNVLPSQVQVKGQGEITELNLFAQFTENLIDNFKKSAEITSSIAHSNVNP